jgi:tRNA-2-methylthio-N6-dimethylallyladenosine synthase
MVNRTKPSFRGRKAATGQRLWVTVPRPVLIRPAQRMPGFHVLTVGCQMNQHDSERMAEVLLKAGYSEAADISDANVILLNTCSVREKAEHKVRSEVGRLALLKQARPDLVLGIAGCVAQQEGERLLRGMPAIDLVVGPDNIGELPALLASHEPGDPPRVRAEFDVKAPAFLSADPSVGKVSATAFVTVMKGCNERCSFCIVPTTRGPERYRPASEILDEVRRLVDAGVREVTLLGQTVNSYIDPERGLGTNTFGGDLGSTARTPDETEFPALLRAIAAAVPELARLRYTSPHPRHLTPSLIEAHAELSVLARHVHMPVQSGSDRVLKRMIRRYSAAEYIDRVEGLRARVPGVTLSTDIIVGFPGETEDDFEATLELVRRVRYNGVYGFKYSVRPYTPALKLPDDIPEGEKATRLAVLFALADGQRQEYLETLVGTSATVLVEGKGKHDAFTGRTERNEIVHFPADHDPTGTLVDVTIVRAFRNSLEGRLGRSSPPPAVPRNERTALEPERRRSLTVL